MNRLLITIITLILFTSSFGQKINSFADSVRIKYKIPELAYAVVSSDSILEMQSLGFQRVNSKYRATINDRFRIGSCTKTITSYITELLVKQGKLKWDTKFFDLYPELKAQSNKAYYNLTLQDFLTFRANLIQWSYDDDAPTKKRIKGNNQQQRYKFVAWILRQKPTTETKTVYWANPSYVAVGLMLEKATGKKYETLVEELGKELGIKFDFGQPNLKDINQPWGHDENLEPEKPALNFKLNWLSSAGNINISLPDYSKFIQLQLQGFLGNSKYFTKEEFEYFHFGLPEFSFGWKSIVDRTNNLKYSYHEGNPGTFLTKTFICKDIDKAFILFANIQSDEAEKGMNIVLKELKKQYGK
jgi:CubicO group peptidase (beta-lactamase class C family)